MQRHYITERADRAQKLEALGFSFHKWDDYWNEGVCYEFSAREIEEIEKATYELHDLYFGALKHVLADDKLLAQLQVPEAYWKQMRDSYEAQGTDLHLYGRFDLSYDGIHQPKLLEYNADTPTSLLEAAVAQWQWLQDVHPDCDQFNSIHEKLIERWKTVVPYAGKIHFTSVNENEEDWVCAHYLMDTAVQAGFEVKHTYLEGIGRDDLGRFYDGDDERITTLFKLYPWEWMMLEDYGPELRSNVNVIEPIWKSLFANKGLLAILWELYPNHPNLLPAYLDGPRNMISYAKKPIFSREGANIQLVEHGVTICEDEGPYGSEGFVYQELCKLPKFDDCYPVIGSWVIGDEAAGMGIREDRMLITTNQSNFVPHFFR
jgi:glutathionylspermidine synthase